MDSESDFVASTLRERVEFENLNESGMKMKCIQRIFWKALYFFIVLDIN